MTVYEDIERYICAAYYVFYDKKIPNFEKIVIPSEKWLVFKIKNQQTDDIQKIIKKFYYEFLPSCKFNLKDLPELEYYHDGITEFLVAID